MIGFAAVVAAGSCRWRCFCAPRRAPAARSPRRPAPARPRRWACRRTSVQAIAVRRLVLCCVPMAMPPSHLVAFCSDLGFPAAQGAAMLSVLLGCAFVSRHVLGLARRPDRRARHGVRGLGLPGAGDRRVCRDPERGRAVHGLGRLRARLQRDHPGLYRGDPRAVPVIRGVMAGADAAVYRHVAGWPSAAGSPARSTTAWGFTRRPLPPAPCSTSAI